MAENGNGREGAATGRADRGQSRPEIPLSGANHADALGGVVVGRGEHRGAAQQIGDSRRVAEIGRVAFGNGHRVAGAIGDGGRSEDELDGVITEGIDNRAIDGGSRDNLRIQG